MGRTKRCAFLGCNSDSRYNPNIKFIPFPKACFPIRKSLIKNENFHINICSLCRKCNRWIDLCGKRKKFTTPRCVSNHFYICLKHFVGGIAAEDSYPDPLPAAVVELLQHVKMSTDENSTPSKRAKIVIEDEENADPLAFATDEIKIESSDEDENDPTEDEDEKDPTLKVERLEEEEVHIKDEVFFESDKESDSSESSNKTETKKKQGITSAKKLNNATEFNIEELKTKIFQFKITLLLGKPPKIWRCIQVPGNYTFRQFHIAIQKAMGWKSVEFDYHLHVFNVKNPKTGATDAIVDADDANGSIRALDQVVKNEDDTPIAEYFNKSGQKGSYEYDFGMGWSHRVLLENILTPDSKLKYPRCIGGQKACPPEDGTVDSDEEYNSDEFDANLCFP